MVKCPEGRGGIGVEEDAVLAGWVRLFERVDWRICSAVDGERCSTTLKR